MGTTFTTALDTSLGSRVPLVLDGGVGKMIDLARSNLRNIPRP